MGSSDRRFFSEGAVGGEKEPNDERLGRTWDWPKAEGHTLGLGGVAEVGSWARSRAQQQQDEVQRTASSPRRGLAPRRTGARALSHELRAPAANCNSSGDLARSGGTVEF